MKILSWIWHANETAPSLLQVALGRLPTYHPLSLITPDMLQEALGRTLGQGPLGVTISSPKPNNR